MSSYPKQMRALLRAAWQAPAAIPGPPRRVWRDGVLVGLAALAAVAEGVFRPGLSAPVLSVAALLLALPTLLWRRTRPLLMLTAMFVVTTPLQLLAPEAVLYTSGVLIVNAYALYRWGTGRALLLGTPLLAVGFGLSALRDGALQDLIAAAAVLLAVILLGTGVRSRASARQRSVERIRTQEREHLARDLHDTVAHHVAAIAIRAQAGLAVAPHDPAAATEALSLIEQEAAKTLTELRAMVGVLRADEAAALAPAAALSDIAQLAGTRPAGATVTVHVQDTGAEVPPVVASAAYRIAQESVTNALRHATGVTTVAVTVTSDAAGVRLRVENDGAISTASDPGFGMIGMRERAALLGGTCHAGPAEGGWVVAAELPRAGWGA